MRLHHAKGRVSFPEPTIQHKSFGGCRFGLRRAFPGCENPEGGAHVVCISKAGIRQCEIWVFFRRLLKELNALLNASRSSLVPVIAALQIKLISLRVIRRMLGQPISLGAVQTQLQLVQYRCGPLVLLSREVGNWISELPAPDLT